MSRLLWIVLSASFALTAAAPAAAQWMWRDKSNKVTMSDIPPPPNIPEKDILRRPQAAERRAQSLAPAASAASSPTLASPKLVEPELEAKRRQAEQEAEAKKKQEEQKVAATKADNCARAQAYKKTLDQGMRIARTNAKGEREILDDKGRAEEAKRTKEIMDSNCN